MASVRRAATMRTGHHPHALDQLARSALTLSLREEAAPQILGDENVLNSCAILRGSDCSNHRPVARRIETVALTPNPSASIAEELHETRRLNGRVAVLRIDEEPPDIDIATRTVGAMGTKSAAPTSGEVADHKLRTGMG